MALHTTPRFGSHGIFGGLPDDWVGADTPDGDRGPWVHAPVGSVYWKRVTTNQQEVYVKVKDDSRNDDWVLDRGTISQYITNSQFTDGGSTTGTKALNASIPDGALFLRTFLMNVSDATGVSTLTIQVGDGTDVDRYTTGTPSVASAASIINPGAPSGTVVHTAAKTPTVTLTEDSDFGDLTAWSATVVMQYTGAAV